MNPDRLIAMVIVVPIIGASVAAEIAYALGAAEFFMPDSTTAIVLALAGPIALWALNRFYGNSIVACMSGSLGLFGLLEAIELLRTAGLLDAKFETFRFGLESAMANLAGAVCYSLLFALLNPFEAQGRRASDLRLSE